MLYVNENFARVRVELSQDQEPSFSSTAKEAAAQWRTLSRSEQAEYTNRAASLREAKRKPFE